jgi:hypothetical protein
VERISDEGRFRAICLSGIGVVYNDFTRGGASAGQYNILHVASCTWLRRANLGVPKILFGDAAEATTWLTSERGPEGTAWRRCRTCGGVGPVPQRSPSADTDASPVALVFTTIRRRCVPDLVGRVRSERRGLVNEAPPVRASWRDAEVPGRPASGS